MTEQIKFLIRECGETACQLRFPQTHTDPHLDACPQCGGRLNIVAEQTQQLVSSRINIPPKIKTAAILDNIRSIHNVGSMFRTADSAGVSHLYLCGITATPDHPKLAKIALGAEKTVSWSHHKNAVQLAQKLQENAVFLVALEGGKIAGSFFELRPPVDTLLCWIVGNEVTGVDPALLKLADHVVAFPQRGKKDSLNVSVAFGIACYASFLQK